MIKLIVALIGFCIFSGLFSSHKSHSSSMLKLPFLPGEVMTYKVKWAFIPAGIATLRVGSITEMRGNRVHHFILEAKTYPYIDVIYKVREKVESYTDMERGMSIFYRIIRRGHSKKDVSVLFDWKNRRAEYIKDGRTEKSVPVLKGTADPLSVFYIFRCMKLDINRVLKRPVSDGKKCVIGIARVIKKETITVSSKRYSTYLVQPEIRHIGGVFKKKKGSKLLIWVTDDQRHIPVRIKSEVAVGSFTADLISYKSGKSASQGKTDHLPLYNEKPL